MSEIITKNPQVQPIFPDFLHEVWEKLDELAISSEDVERARVAAKDATNGILWQNSNFVIDIRDAMVEKLQASLDNIQYPRYIDFWDIEQAIVYLREYFEKKWHEFRKFDFPDALWDKDDFESLFSRKIMQAIIERYLSSFPAVEKKQVAWKWRTKKKELGPLQPKLANILHNPILEELLMTLTRKWMIKVSDNIWNKFSKEIEQKILQIDKEDVIARLEEMEGVEKRFEWYVTDTYYDFPDNRLEKADLKSSFRIRKKECAETGKVKYYYTVKRKDKASTNLTWVRDCWEEEFEITNTDVRHIQDVLKSFWMHEFKSKEKYRVSYQHRERGAKFDIDDYKWIPTFMEIEAEKLDVMDEFKHLLWIQDNPTFNGGTTKLKKAHGVPYPKFDLREE